MTLDKLGTVYNWINKINPNVKTIIIVVLTLLIIHYGYKQSVKSILIDYQNKEVTDKKSAEDYTRLVAPQINYEIESILNEDKDASNVVLLNYHNTLSSTNGLSYKFLTSLTEKRRGINTRSCLRVWKELEYINYNEEIEKINSMKYVCMENIDKYKQQFPNITELLRISEAKSAALYPIIGINGPIGMLVIIYPKEKEYSSDYYRVVIAPVIQPLVSLLDYDSVKQKLN